jgi:hypothetical protein
MFVRVLTIAAAATLALAQGPPAGSEPPKLHGETLEGKTIVLPDAAAGKVTMLVLGASRKGGDRTGAWREHFAADFGSNARADYYVAALLQSVPGMIRGMIRSGMRGGTPPAGRSHVVTCASDENAWKKYLAMTDDALPSVLLLDASGRVRWSYNGVFDEARYRDLKSATAAALESPSSN